MFSLSGFNFVFGSSVAIIVGFLPLFLVGKGFTNTEVGIIFSTGPFISLIAQPIWGFICDKRKSAKSVLLSLLIVSLFLSWGLFISGSFVMNIVLMIGFMFFLSPVGPLTDSMTFSFAKQKGRSYGSIRLWSSAGFAVSSMGIGMLLEKVGLIHLDLFYYALIIFAIFALFFVQDTKLSSAPINKSSVKKLFKNKEFVIFLAVAALAGIPHRLNDSILGLYLNELGATKGQIGSAWMFASLSEIPVFAVSVLLFRKYHPMFLITIATILYTLRWVAFGYIKDPTVISILQITHGVTFALFFVASLEYISMIVSDEVKATSQTTFAAIFGGIGGIIGSLTGGMLLDRVSPNLVYYASSFISLLSILVAVSILVRVIKQKKLAPS
jgi:MFS transporter, PPP family, 3-phenylpropionic acid transporter